MHELGIVFYVIDACEKLAKENNVKVVKKATLEVGEVSTVVPSLFKDCFEWAKKRTETMKNCDLDFIVIKGVTYCTNCKKTYSTTKYGKECPHCHSTETYLLTGNDVKIKSIEVEDNEDNDKASA